MPLGRRNPGKGSGKRKVGKTDAAATPSGGGDGGSASGAGAASTGDGCETRGLREQLREAKECNQAQADDLDDDEVEFHSASGDEPVEGVPLTSEGEEHARDNSHRPTLLPHSSSSAHTWL
mmetsp:Transcript_24053/g.59660  ORF Transcript_24053/g.59660 Transcript_24053/m.59660 type:complete len:121 (-) Transcript_24053:318-680(-)